MINCLVWIGCGIAISYLTSKYVLKKKDGNLKIYSLGILGALFISLLINILGVKFEVLSLGNIFIACIGSFIAIFAVKKQI